MLKWALLLVKYLMQPFQWEGKTTDKKDHNLRAIFYKLESAYTKEWFPDALLEDLDRNTSNINFIIVGFAQTLSRISRSNNRRQCWLISIFKTNTLGVIHSSSKQPWAAYCRAYDEYSKQEKHVWHKITATPVDQPFSYSLVGAIFFQLFLDDTYKTVPELEAQCKLCYRHAR